MTTRLGRADRDRLAAAVLHPSGGAGRKAPAARVDEVVLEAAIALLCQYAAGAADEPIGRAAATVAGRLQLCVPMTALVVDVNEPDPPDLALH
ncbi:hypothetical protein AB0D08_20500 [Kitasatospora sp. NPDC048540]|uniref:hypothetical protein n=1 Tax=Kitasatospora sp. NPDC048540 TaxID=3155634 RepID=UPI003410D1DF